RPEMGLDINGVRFLCFAKACGVNFASSGMLGRQKLILTERQLDKVLRCFAIAANAHQLLNEESGFAEPLLRVLGAVTIRSFDASNYENATVVHDFNDPMDSSWNSAFTVFID